MKKKAAIGQEVSRLISKMVSSNSLLWMKNTGKIIKIDTATLPFTNGCSWDILPAAPRLIYLSEQTGLIAGLIRLPDASGHRRFVEVDTSIQREVDAPEKFMTIRQSQHFLPRM